MGVSRWLMVEGVIGSGQGFVGVHQDPLPARAVRISVAVSGNSLAK
jgi:hypothetical protein